MDPNVPWQRILETADRLVQRHPDDTDVLDLAYDLLTLGEWFARGGHAPNDLPRARPVHGVVGLIG